MNIRFIIAAFFLFFGFSASAQDSIVWKEKAKFSIDTTDIWTSDVLGNLYVTKKELIQKYDSTGVLKFSQSQKAIGRLSSLDPINTMKLIFFSEEQQIFCFLDNTLTPYESCIDLSDYDIGNASLVTISSQPNKFWVFDQLNSRLHLLSLTQSAQSQEVENLRGILNSIQISSMLEQNNLLYLVDTTNGVFILDMYGSLVNTYRKSGVKEIQADSKFLFLLTNDGMISIVDLATNVEKSIDCPLENTIEFRKNGNYYFFRSKTEIKKYKLLFVE